jgi:hypothetical protein
MKIKYHDSIKQKQYFYANRMHSKIDINLPDYFQIECVFKSGQCDFYIRVTYTISTESLRTTYLVKSELLQFTFSKEEL